MKRTISILTALIVLSPVVLWAQPADDATPAQCPKGDVRARGHGHDGPGRGDMRMNLSEEQREKMKALREEFKPKFQEAMKSGDKEKIKAVHDEFLAKAKGFLSEEQAAKMEKFGKAMHKRMKNRREKMGPQLNLTDDQKTKMQELRKKHAEEMKALREKHQAEVKAILTPEQAAKWEAWKKEKQERMKDRCMDRRGKKGRGHWGKGKGKHGDGMKGKGKGPCGTDDKCPTDCPVK